ncbi:FAD NAD(P)-binding domain-containing [Fusarium albosuccineum]|uniref:FAD NAD(P)-binding domain-containing n=1 Tax=Fusarium albosuccineum TaxID=1237068 RepID=A0A8H4PEL7_9HYPO|nr:FAD NAD(P)-binding domain-containing [Fusarium albosuccineum]
MTNEPVTDWNDDAIRPPDADTRIGWAGVPLSQTLGYYGHIKRATLPLNNQLGFTPDYASVPIGTIAEAFVSSFSSAIQAQDVEAILGHIFGAGYWKDVEMLTWDIRTLHGHDNIRPMLKERLGVTGISNLRLSPHAPASLERLGDDLSFILLHISFDFAHGTGVAVARLSPFSAQTGSAAELADPKSWKIYTIGTTVETVQGWDAETGDKLRYERGKVHDPEGKGRSYRELRHDETEFNDGSDPTVIIVGAGQTGLAMAARLKVLGIPHLIIEKEDRAGHSWASRYSSLSLHGPTFTNHLPCLPFPHWFPVFLPAQQLASYLQHYAGIMDLNIWTNSHIDGENAVYDEERGRWSLSVIREDGSKRVLHPRHLMITTGISGTLPNVPEVKGMSEFEKNGGLVAHSSRYRSDPTLKGKRCIIVGAATSAHDLTYELYESGCEVTMIQRSATHVMSVEKSVRHLFRARESVNRRGGLPVEVADEFAYLRQPMPVEYELLARGQKEARKIDHDLLESLRNVGYRLHDGYHGGGAYSMFHFDQGGFYWDTGCCKLIADKKVKLVHTELDRFTKDGVVYKDGTTQQADVVIFATGYMDSKSAIQALLGDDMAKKCHERWEKGNAFFVGPEGESLINYCPLPQKGLYAMFHQFAFTRFHSARLALRIKAEELGIDVTPYGNKPLGPPSTAAGRQPRPEGAPL